MRLKPSGCSRADSSFFEEIGGAPSWLTGDVDETREFVEGKLGEAELAAEWERGQKVPTDEAIELALVRLSGDA